VASYLGQVAPLLAGAILIVGIIGLMVFHQETSGVRSLFAAVAALAAPHLLITPLFERMSSGPAVPRHLDRAAVLPIRSVL